MNAATVTLVECPKCGGSGKLSQFKHVEGGTCFLCTGAGECTEDQAHTFMMGTGHRFATQGLEVVPALNYKTKEIELPTFGKVEIRRYEDGGFALATASNVGTLVSLFVVKAGHVHLTAACEGHLSPFDVSETRYVDDKRPWAYQGLRNELQAALRK